MSDKRMIELILQHTVKSKTATTIELTNLTTLFFGEDGNFIGISDDNDVQTLHEIKDYIIGE